MWWGSKKADPFFNLGGKHLGLCWPRAVEYDKQWKPKVLTDTNSTHWTKGVWGDASAWLPELWHLFFWQVTSPRTELIMLFSIISLSCKNRLSWSKKQFFCLWHFTKQYAVCVALFHVHINIKIYLIILYPITGLQKIEPTFLSVQMIQWSLVRSFRVTMTLQTTSGG